MHTQHLAAHGDEDELGQEDHAHDDQEVAVAADVLKHIGVLGAGVEAVEGDGHHEGGEHRGVQHDAQRVHARIGRGAHADQVLDGRHEADGQAGGGDVQRRDDDLDQHRLRHDGGVPGDGLFLHVFLQRRLGAEGDGGQGVHGQVDQQQLDHGEDLVLAEERGQEAGQHRGHVDGQLEDQELADALEHRAAVEYGLVDGGEVVVQYRDVAGLLGHLGAGAHGEAHVGLLQGRGIVHAVAGHAHHQVQLLGEAHQAALVGGQGPGHHPQVGQYGLQLVVALVGHLGGGHGHVGGLAQQPGLPGDGHGGLLAVAGHHDHLDARVLDLLDGGDDLPAHVVADGQHAHQGQVVAVGVALGLRHAQQAHGAARLGVHVGQQRGLGLVVQGPHRAGLVDIVVAAVDDALRRALDIGDGSAVPGDGHVGHLLGGVEGVEGDDLLLAHVRHGVLAQQEGHHGPVRAVAAQDLVAGDGGGVVDADAGDHVRLHGGGQLGKLCKDALVAGGQLHHGQAALGDGAGLVGEQHRQAAGGLQAVDLAHQHVVLDHADALEGQQYAGEHRQALGHRADDDGDGHGHRLDDQRRPAGEGGFDVVIDDVDQYHADDDGDGADVAEGGDLLGQLGQLHLQGRLAGVLLDLQGQLAEQGLVADDLDLHVALAAADHGAAVGVVGVQQVLDLIGLAVGVGALGGLLGLAVQRGLVHHHLALDDLAVGGQLVAGLEVDDVAHHDLGHVDLVQLAVAQHLGLFLDLLLGLQQAGLALLAVLGEGGHAVGQQYGDQHADRLVPLGLVHQPKHHLHGQGDQQDHDHRVLEALEYLLPQRVRRYLGQRVGAVFVAALLHLLLGQAGQFHCN